MANHYQVLNQFMDTGTTVLHIDTQWNNRWKECDNEVIHTRGNLSFTCNVGEINTLVSDWAWCGDRSRAPRSTDDLHLKSFAELMEQAHREAERDWLAKVAFPAIYADEAQKETAGNTIDELDEENISLPEGIEEAILKDEEMLEEMPLPGVPGHEKSRRARWLKIPRRARAAIRKMHKEWGHLNKTVLKKYTEDRKSTTRIY